MTVFRVLTYLIIVEFESAEDLAQKLVSNEWPYLWIYYSLGLGFAVTWGCWSYLKTAIQPKIQRLLACLRTFASHLSKIEQFLINKLGMVQVSLTD